MLRPILIHPDSRLKKPSAPVSEITDEIRDLARDLLHTMYDAPGVGLAAPQVGVLQRVFVMDCVKDPELPPRPMALINPKVVWASDEKASYEEGCLSIPEVYHEIERPAVVRVAWTDLSGAACEDEFFGLWATCAQHEIDHLDGKLFIDYLGPMKRQMITRKMEKRKRDMARDPV
jgi:peptide deformylase